MNEVITLALVYSISMLLLWLSTREDPKLKANWSKPFGVFIRMGAFHLLMHVFLYTLPFPTWESYLVIALFVGLCFISIWLDFGLLAIVIIGWAIYQWAFWFPVKDEVVLKNEIKEEKKKKEEPSLKHGVTSSDLKPIGKVMFEGKEHTAISTLGFIPAGEKILIEGTNGNELKVRKEIG